MRKPPPRVQPGDVGAGDTPNVETDKAKSPSEGPRVRPPLRLDVLRDRLHAACGAELRGRFRVVIDVGGRARLVTPGAPACAEQAVATWAPGAPAETLDLSLPIE